MHKHGFDPDTNPVYTRNPFGSVVLTKSGEVKEKVKFTAAVKKPKKKKGEEDTDNAE